MDAHILECYMFRLPDEIVVRILLGCSYSDILFFASTCRRYSNVVSNSATIQLHIELEANGLQTTERSLEYTKDHTSLLKKLRRHRDAWLDLNIRSSTNYDCNLEEGTLWELRDGVFAKALRHNQPESIFLLPFDFDGTRTQVNFGTAFDEFTMDLSQDLIVLAGVEADQLSHGWLRLCSSTTGQAHPQARKPLLELDLGFEVRVGQVRAGLPPSLTLEIKNDLVAAKFECTIELVYEILIWNWKTGRLMHRINSDNGLCSFGFLDSDRLIVWSARRSTDKSFNLPPISLVVYAQLSCAGPGYEVPDSGVLNISSLPTLQPAFTFRFPKLKASNSVRREDFLLRSDYGSGSRIGVSSPFTCSRALTLGLTMSIQLRGDMCSLRIFVDALQLVRHMELAQGRSISELDWDEWGEHATRWFHARHPTHRIGWMFGSRSMSQGEHLSVVDFHTPTVRRHANRRQNTYFSPKRSEEFIAERLNQINQGCFPNAFSEDDIKYGQLDGWNRATMDENAVIIDFVTSQEPTIISLFKKPVTSRLPYRIVTLVQLLGGHEGWLISGKQLIGMGVCFCAATRLFTHCSPCAWQGSGWTTSADELTVYTIGGSDDEDTNNL
ncbi:hypothetical protein FRC09_000821 [Ceratobasidium sp. 395]|nr:hypothetical protein FRC09_000821 [Ceratobasidium sp. 395]